MKPGKTTMHCMAAEVSKGLRLQGINRSTTQKVLRAYFGLVKQYTLEEGLSVEVGGFGVFYQGHTAPKRLFNPQTGQEMQSAPTVSVRFSPSSRVKRRLS